uniref:Uncharacterized protein n=1 Tax=Rhizophora mucronata TaxID=61149 RepID=A0A2P2PEQ1_RHIMU
MCVVLTCDMLNYPLHSIRWCLIYARKDFLLTLFGSP